ncbi:MAG: FMN-binding protein [Proteobacteria bacterium]|nr:FMN-binding protein [Pseudomonadota bacterium]NIS68049.1 FMN-binding protein [Pseudomonadota bacterium]
MARISKRRLSLLAVSFTLSLTLVYGGLAKSSAKVAGFGDLFPQYTFDSPAASEDRVYLGLAEVETFTVADIQADLIIFEVLNTYCTSCQRQASIYNGVFRLVEGDPVTKGRIKWLAVAVGNNETEVEAFRKEKSVPFPMLTDVHFEFYDVIGGPGGVRTPLTMLVRKGDRGEGIVVESHIGFRGKEEEIFQEIKAALQYDLAYLKFKTAERAVLPATEELTPPFSDEDLLQTIKEGMEIPGVSVLEVRKIRFRKQVVYLGRVATGSESKQFFAKVVSRPPLCDVCHDIHFTYVFDEAGKVVNFLPIYVTKNANRPWSDQDVQKMRDRIVGQSLLMPFRFDRDVDAVSGATVTSVVIFDGINRGKSIYADLMRKGYVK